MVAPVEENVKEWCLRWFGFINKIPEVVFLQSIDMLQVQGIGE